MTGEASSWLTEEAERKVRARAMPWSLFYAPAIEHFDGTAGVDHRTAIERKLAAAPDGTHLVAALPPSSGVIDRFEGCWTVLHERTIEHGPSVLVVRKGLPAGGTYRFFFPKVWRVGDTYSIFSLFNELQARLEGVELHFENDIRRIYPDAKITPVKAAAGIAWDGVLNQCSFWSEITSELAKSVHYYERPVEVAKRMGWLPQHVIAPSVPRAFPIDDSQEAWAREHVSHDPLSYVAVVQKSSCAGRDWPVQNTMQLLRWLDERGIPTVVIGLRGEQPFVQGYTWKKCIDLVGKGNLGEIAAVIHGARLLISPDTGLMHIACGLGVPSLALFGPTVYHDITRPPVTNVMRMDGGCSGCYRGSSIDLRCKGKIDCMKAISVEQVTDAVIRVLGISGVDATASDVVVSDSGGGMKGTEGRKRESWLTEDVENKVRQRVNPWTLTGARVIEHFEPLPQADHRRLIQAKLDAAKEGTVLVGALPPKSGVTSPFKGCWTVLHENVDRQCYGPSCLVVRKGYPMKRKYRFLMVDVTQIGDAYVLMNLLDVLKERLHDVEFVFDCNMSRVFPQHTMMTKAETDKVAWDGVFVPSFMLGEVCYSLYRKVHFYDINIEIAKRMGWLPASMRPLAVSPKPFPLSDKDVAWARGNVPHDPDTYVAIVQRSSYWPRDWADARSIRLAQWLDMNGVPTVMIGLHGTAPEVEGYEFKHCTNLLGKGNVGEVSAVIRNARLAVTPDTGLMHIACGFGVPTVAEFGPSEYRYLTRPPVVPVTRKDGGCIECYADQQFYKACKGNVDCMKQLTTMQVIEKVAGVLGIEPAHDWKRPTISLCMMVKNEMKMLPGALDSARQMVDEIVVVDTGSTDGTREWIAEQPDVRDFVYDIGEKIESFSEVRNFAFSKATSKYVMWLDACERLVDAKALGEMVRQEHYDGYSLPIRHGPISYVREKVFPRVFARFLDRIHEFAQTDGLWIGTTPPNLGVDRLYYEKQNRESSESRNVRLLKLQLEEAPNHPRAARWLYYLGRDFMDAKKFDEALSYLKRRVGLEGFWEERYAAGILLCRIYLYHKREFMRARKTAEALIDLSKDRREGYYCKAESYYWAGAYEESLGFYERMLSIPRPISASLWLWEEVYAWLPHDRISRIREHMGQREAAIAAAKVEMQMAPPAEHGWIVERIKGLSGVPTLV